MYASRMIPRGRCAQGSWPDRKGRLSSLRRREIRPVWRRARALDESFDAALVVPDDLRSDRWTRRSAVPARDRHGRRAATRAPLALRRSLARQLIGLATTGRDATESGAPGVCAAKKEICRRGLIAEINKENTFEACRNLIRRTRPGTCSASISFLHRFVIGRLQTRSRPYRQGQAGDRYS